jgi:hypothetical protein
MTGQGTISYKNGNVYIGIKIIKRDTIASYNKFLKSFLKKLKATTIYNISYNLEFFNSFPVMFYHKTKYENCVRVKITIFFGIGKNAKVYI